MDSDPAGGKGGELARRTPTQVLMAAIQSFVEHEYQGEAAVCGDFVLVAHVQIVGADQIRHEYAYVETPNLPQHAGLGLASKISTHQHRKS